MEDKKYMNYCLSCNRNFWGEANATQCRECADRILQPPSPESTGVEIKYAQLWARHSGLFYTNAGMYLMDFEGMKKAVQEALSIDRSAGVKGQGAVWVKADIKPPKFLETYYCKVRNSQGTEYKKTVLITLDGQWQSGPLIVLEWLDESPTVQPNPEEISHDAHEKEIMMQAFDKVRQIFEMRSWIMEGRGSYPYNDDRYKEEVRNLYDEFEAIRKDTWANIQSKSFEYREREQPNKEDAVAGLAFIAAVTEEGAEAWKMEYDACRSILTELVDLKNLKEMEGKSDDYMLRQPVAWIRAKRFLEKYQHVTL